MSEADIRREVWDGKIPVCFSVDQSELGPSQLPLPEPCFVSTHTVAVGTRLLSHSHLRTRLIVTPFLYILVRVVYLRTHM